MAAIPGGEFLMGSDRHYLEEQPTHPVRVAAVPDGRACRHQRPVRRLRGANGYVTTAPNGR